MNGKHDHEKALVRAIRRSRAHGHITDSSGRNGVWNAEAQATGIWREGGTGLSTAPYFLLILDPTASPFPPSELAQTCAA